MKKRFTDCDIWNKEWFQNAPLRIKCAWRFLCDNCSNAGIWDVNIRLMAFQIGEPFEESELLDFFGDKITVLGERKWLLTGFVKFQYGCLSESCRPHLKVIEELKANGVAICDGVIQRVSDRVSDRVSHTLQDKEEDKEEEEDTDKDQDKDPARGKAKDVLEVMNLAVSMRFPASDGEWFFETMEAGGWMRGQAKLKNWKAHFRAWAKAGHMPSQKAKPDPAKMNGMEYSKHVLGGSTPRTIL